jgi:hypothetical protein
MIRISVTSKLDGVRSWSLQARETCPGSIGSDGQLVPACAGCYAVGGNYRYPNVKEPRIENREDWQRTEWVADMVEALRNDRFFRWFDSGDMYALPLAEKILEVMTQTPHVQHWLPTRMHKFKKYASVLARMQALANVVVRPSSDSVTGDYVPGIHGSTIVPSIDQVPAGATLCHAATNAGKCGACRMCYSKDVAVVAYVAHGRSMMKVVREQLAA